MVESGTPGFTRGRRLEKVGLKANDTAELFFDDCRIPADHLLGQENAGFYHLMANLPRERLGIAVAAVASAEHVLAITPRYAKTRQAFGKPIGSFQHNRFVLAELDTEVTIARTFLNQCIVEQNAARLSVADAAKAKWWTTELQNKVADRCVQLHGGYGFMMEYPVAKAWLNSRVQTIYGGTTEIMKEIIGRSLGVCVGDRSERGEDQRGGRGARVLVADAAFAEGGRPALAGLQRCRRGGAFGGRPRRPRRRPPNPDGAARRRRRRPA